LAARAAIGAVAGLAAAGSHLEKAAGSLVASVNSFEAEDELAVKKTRLHFPGLAPKMDGEDCKDIKESEDGKNN